MFALIAVVALALASAPPVGLPSAFARDQAALDTCIAGLTRERANWRFIEHYAAQFSNGDATTMVPEAHDLPAIERFATQADACIVLSRKLTQQHLPQAATAHAAMEARIAIVRTFLLARRITYDNAAALVWQAEGEFGAQKVALLMADLLPARPEHERQIELDRRIENHRKLLAELKSIEQTADMATPNVRCHWNQARIRCWDRNRKRAQAAWLIARGRDAAIVEIWRLDDGTWVWRLLTHEGVQLAEMPQPDVPPNHIVSQGLCTVDGTSREDVIAIVRRREHEKWWTEVHTAWIADPKARAFVPLKGAKIRCENESLGE